MSDKVELNDNDEDDPIVYVKRRSTNQIIINGIPKNKTDLLIRQISEFAKNELIYSLEINLNE